MSCRDDADDFDIALFAHGVSHQQHRDILDNPYRLPSLFAVFDAVLLYESIGVGKDAGRRLKAHSVLSEVAGRFGGVPFKARLHTFMLLHFRSSVLTSSALRCPAKWFTWLAATSLPALCYCVRRTPRMKS